MAASNSEIPTASPDDELSYLNALITHARGVDEAKGALRGVKKRAKNVGVDTKAADFAESCRKRGDKGRAHGEAVIRSLFLTNIVDRSFLQALIDSNESASEHVLKEHLLAVAEDDGWRDGHDGISQEESRYPSDSEQTAVWSRGWARGASAKQLELGLEGKVPAATKELPVGRRERKDIPDITDGFNGNGSVTAKRRGRPPGAKNKPKPIIEEAPMHAA